MMGKVIMSGIVPQLVAPKSPEISAEEIAVGSIVKLMENGVATEYLVVNLGVPENNSNYGSGCDGLWLLRKDCFDTAVSYASGNSTYNVSDLHNYLENTFFSRFDADTQATIQTVTIPFYANKMQGAKTISARVFALSGYEVGFTPGTSSNDGGRLYLAQEGGRLSYFSDTVGTSNDSKRIATVDGVACDWWLRSNNRSQQPLAFCVDTTGNLGNIAKSTSCKIRPALILPRTALFDKNTLLFKGVS